MKLQLYLNKMLEEEVASRVHLGWVSFPDVEWQSGGAILRTKAGRQGGFGVRQDLWDGHVFTPSQDPALHLHSCEKDLSVARGYKHWVIQAKWERSEGVTWASTRKSALSSGQGHSEMAMPSVCGEWQPHRYRNQDFQVRSGSAFSQLETLSNCFPSLSLSLQL